MSQVFAGQNVGVKQVSEQIWLVTFMQYDLGYFDEETCRLEPIENPFGPKVLPMSPASPQRHRAQSSFFSLHDILDQRTPITPPIAYGVASTY